MRSSVTSHKKDRQSHTKNWAVARYVDFPAKDIIVQVLTDKSLGTNVRDDRAELDCSQENGEVYSQAEKWAGLPQDERTTEKNIAWKELMQDKSGKIN